MKKKILSLGAAIAICLGVWTYSVSQSNVELSTLALANVEALTWGEGGSGYNDTGCMLCITMYSNQGAIFFCKYGSGRCYTMSCSTGTC